MPASRISLRTAYCLFLAVTVASAILARNASAQDTVTSVPSGEVLRAQPVWWFGGAAAGNMNLYWGTTQQLNDGFATPAAFHKGIGAGLYLAPLIEYRPGPKWGGILQIGYDDRRASFYDVTCPCGENSTLSAKPSYLSIEPSLRLAPFSGDFYVFAGPRIAYAWSPFGDEKSFVYTQEGVEDVKGDFSDARAFVFSGQVGMGYDIHLNSINKKTQVHLAPFVSYQPHFGQDPRSTENWAVSTLRAGLALKFGRGKRLSTGDGDVRFSAKVPQPGASKRRVKETFPLRNYVFFEDSATTIPDRYVALTPGQAADFREEQLQEAVPKSMKGRSQRQMGVYYNILNTVGDRMRRNPKTRITLAGSSVRGSDHGKARAEQIKGYLTGVFGIEGSRISTEGRENARAADQTAGTDDMRILQAGNQKVEITSTSPEMLALVGGTQDNLRPVSLVGPVEARDSIVFSNVGAERSLTSWTLEIKDDKSTLRRFGPYAGNRATLPAVVVLGERSEGDYNVAMVGQARDGAVVRKEVDIRLTRPREGIQEITRFTILFDFGQTKTVESYENFLAEGIAPLIPDSSTVTVSGQTDIVGDDKYNENLARERAQGTRRILEKAAEAKGKRGVNYETEWHTEDSDQAPFDNDLPEGRAYNRTVIIDIAPK